jgi:peptidoglycan/LPS O-acetylase OafA/YrhL
MSSRPFLPIVDALRALAVISVVGYHAGLPFLPGGYVGVDIFFVISGFLIIGHIAQELRQGTFRYSAFYARRALRILPPYFLVIVACLVIAPFVLVLPGEYEEFGREVTWSAGMMANYLFLSQQGYFDASANTKVLLHLWSLAVEEQFYLVAPFVLAAGWVALKRLGRFGPSLTVAIGIGAFVASLYWCIALTDPDNNHAFYQMPLRAWEFMAGGALWLVLPIARRLPRLVLELLLLIGLCTAVTAIALFTHDTPFPSFWACIPVAGACLAIIAGVALPDGRLARAVTVRPVLAIGLVSYSWYLWHWPLLTFGRMYNFGQTDLAFDLAMVACALALAFLTYRFVERPILALRKSGRIQVSWQPTFAGLACSIPIALVGLALSTLVVSASSARMPANETDERSRVDDCLTHQPCPASGPQRTGLLLGDSHANAAFTMINRHAQQFGAGLISATFQGCPPLFDTDLVGRSPNLQRICLETKQKALDLMDAEVLKPQFAVITARWVAYTPWEGRETPSQGRYLVKQVEQAEAPQDQHAQLVSSLRHTFDVLRAKGVERILVVGPTPELFVNGPECFLRARHYGKDPAPLCAAPRADVEERREHAMAALTEAVAGREDARLVDPLPALCDEVLCRPNDGDVVLFTDDDHVSSAGQEKIIAAYAQDYDWVLSGEGI